MLKFFKTTNILLSLPVFCASAICSAAPTDFNGDSKSDFSFVRIDDDDNLDWRTIPNTGTIVLASNFGDNGIHLMPGKYSQTANTEPAYVDSEGVWSFLVDNDTETYEFGADQATYFGGADFDGDGYTDLAYHDNTCEKKRTTVNIVSNIFNTPTEYEVAGGNGKYFSTYADINGDGKDDYCYLTPIKIAGKLNGNFYMRCRDIVSNQLLPRFLIRKVNSRPQAIKTGAGLPDALLTKREANGKTIVTIRSHTGALLDKFSFDATGGYLLIGNYTNNSPAAEQVAYHKDQEFYLYDLSTKQTILNAVPEGISFDHININDFESGDCVCHSGTIKNGVCTASSSGGSGGTGHISGSCEVDRDITDGANGFLHKPVADSRNEPVVLFNRSDDPSACWFERSDNSLFKEMYFHYYSNPDRPTFRPKSSGSCSTYPTPLIIACNVRGTKNCWHIPKPCTRYD